MFARLIMTMTNTVDDRKVRSALSDRDSSSVLAPQEKKRDCKRFPFHGEDMQTGAAEKINRGSYAFSKMYLLSYYVFTSPY